MDPPKDLVVAAYDGLVKSMADTTSKSTLSIFTGKAADQGLYAQDFSKFRRNAKSFVVDFAFELAKEEVKVLDRDVRFRAGTFNALFVHLGLHEATFPEKCAPPGKFTDLKLAGDYNRFTDVFEGLERGFEVIPDDYNDEPTEGGEYVAVGDSQLPKLQAGTKVSENIIVPTQKPKKGKKGKKGITLGTSDKFLPEERGLSATALGKMDIRTRLRHKFDQRQEVKHTQEEEAIEKAFYAKKSVIEKTALANVDISTSTTQRDYWGAAFADLFPDMTAWERATRMMVMETREATEDNKSPWDVKWPSHTYLQDVQGCKLDAQSSSVLLNLSKDRESFMNVNSEVQKSIASTKGPTPSTISATVLQQPQQASGASAPVSPTTNTIAHPTSVLRNPISAGTTSAPTLFSDLKMDDGPPSINSSLKHGKKLPDSVYTFGKNMHTPTPIKPPSSTTFNFSSPFKAADAESVPAPSSEPPIFGTSNTVPYRPVANNIFARAAALSSAPERPVSTDFGAVSAPALFTFAAGSSLPPPTKPEESLVGSSVNALPEDESSTGSSIAIEKEQVTVELHDEISFEEQMTDEQIEEQAQKAAIALCSQSPGPAQDDLKSGLALLDLILAKPCSEVSGESEISDKQDLESMSLEEIQAEIDELKLVEIDVRQDLMSSDEELAALEIVENTTNQVEDPNEQSVSNESVFINDEHDTHDSSNGADEDEAPSVSGHTEVETHEAPQNDVITQGEAFATLSSDGITSTVAAKAVVVTNKVKNEDDANYGYVNGYEFLLQRDQDVLDTEKGMDSSEVELPLNKEDATMDEVSEIPTLGIALTIIEVHDNTTEPKYEDDANYDHINGYEYLMERDRDVLDTDNELYSSGDEDKLFDTDIASNGTPDSEPTSGLAAGDGMIEDYILETFSRLEKIIPEDEHGEVRIYDESHEVPVQDPHEFESTTHLQSYACGNADTPGLSDKFDMVKLISALEVDGLFVNDVAEDVEKTGTHFLTLALEPLEDIEGWANNAFDDVFGTAPQHRDLELDQTPFSELFDEDMLSGLLGDPHEKAVDTNEVFRVFTPAAGGPVEGGMGLLDHFKLKSLTEIMAAMIGGSGVPECAALIGDESRNKNEIFHYLDMSIITKIAAEPKYPQHSKELKICRDEGKSMKALSKNAVTCTQLSTDDYKDTAAMTTDGAHSTDQILYSPDGTAVTVNPDIPSSLPRSNH